MLYHANWVTRFQGLLFYCWIQSDFIISIFSKFSIYIKPLRCDPFVTRKLETQGEVTICISHPWEYSRISKNITSPRWEPRKYFFHMDGHLNGKVANCDFLKLPSVKPLWEGLKITVLKLFWFFNHAELTFDLPIS